MARGISVFIHLLLFTSLTKAEFTQCAKTLNSLLSSTIQYYNSYAAGYAGSHMVDSPLLLRQRESFLAQLPAGSDILDLGAGPGRDAKIFKERGHHVVIYEPSDSLAQIAEQQTDLPVERKTAQELDVIEGFNGVWAMASLIHAPIEELPSVFAQIERSIKPGGIFYASFIDGVGVPNRGEVEAKGRFFSRVNEAKLREITALFPDLEIVEELTFHQNNDYPGHVAPTAQFGFFNFVVRKRQPPNVRGKYGLGKLKQSTFSLIPARFALS